MRTRICSKSMVKAVVETLMGREADSLCAVRRMGRVAQTGSIIATDTASDGETPEWARSTWPFPTCAREVTFRNGGRVVNVVTVVGILPIRATSVCLVGSVLAEQNGRMERIPAIHRVGRVVGTSSGGEQEG